MQIEDRINAFRELGSKINRLSPSDIDELGNAAQAKNAWFTRDSVLQALEGIQFMLQEDKLSRWLSKYDLIDQNPQIVGIVMPGNIPLVGFHDLLSVLITGHFAAVKPSSDDEVLTRTIIDWIIDIEPRFKRGIEIRDKLTNIDAVIATGSDNTARYFEYYFRDVPHIIRKNRSSVAIISGEESEEELRALGSDIFTFYGLGCRNVSKVYTPVGYDLTKVFPHFERFENISNHNKYRNNYDYYKSIYLVNKTPHLDTGFLLVNSTDELVSPISVLFHQEYESLDDLTSILEGKKDKIQCIVGKDFIPFGKAQRPELWDYADNVDTLQFLAELKQ